MGKDQVVNTPNNANGAGFIRELGPHYRSGKNDLGENFFLPCLRYCCRYDRASGYFSSSVLFDWAEVLPRISEPHQVQIRLLISPILSQEDIQAISNATNELERNKLRQISGDSILNNFIEKGKFSPSKKKILQLFAWLIANDRMSIRFAFPSHISGAKLYHEKYGVFAFPDGATVAFIGSANESFSGHHSNYESVDVYRSWIDGEASRIFAKTDQFEEAWKGEAHGLVVASPSPEILDKIRIIAPVTCPNFSSGDQIPSFENSTNPQNLKWRHQDEAIEKFLAARCGVVEMATGTGKTRVALRATASLIEQNEIDSVIVCTGGTDLLDQWYNETTEFLFDNNLAVYRHFGANHQINRFLSHPNNSMLLVSRDALASVLSRLTREIRLRTLIIHDEVHGFGSPGMVASLAGAHVDIPYRLGLSATPEREYDEEGTTFISMELGKVIYQFGLEDAIKRGILCEFDYVALEYELSQNDRERIKKIYSQKAARAHQGTPMPDQELFRLISDVYKTAENKPVVFSNYLQAHPELLHHSIIFAHTKEFAIRVIEEVHRITPNYSTYFDDDCKDKLIAFGRGDLECLITCHRISQGIDIRHLENVILLSSDRARLETIQRIGRCLRIDPDNPHKRARVLDFVRADNEDRIYSADRDRQVWLESVSGTRREE